MIDRLRTWSGGRPGLALLAAASALATALIIATGMTPSAAQVAALAAAREHAGATQDVAAAELATRRPATVPTPAAPVVPGGSSGAGSDSAPSPTPASPSTSNTTALPAAAPTTAPAPTTAGPAAPPPASTPSASLAHVFEIVIPASDYASAFGPDSSMPYLRSLAAHGSLLSDYSSLGRGVLADELALIGGEPPNADTSAGCPTYAEFPTGTTPDAHGVVTATGCVYPETVLSIGDQVTSSGHTWRAYVDGMGSTACVHPNSDAADNAVLSGAGPTYDTRANPFIYFHSLLDLGDCASDDVDLRHLRAGLRIRTNAPAFTFIAPGICEMGPAATGSDAPQSGDAASSATSTTTTSSTATSPSCPAGSLSGPAATDAFLRQWVPRVMASPAYRSKGALVIAVAASSESPQPVRTGALVISSTATKGRLMHRALDPYAVLRGIETALGYSPLAEARTASTAMSAVFK